MTFKSFDRFEHMPVPVSQWGRRSGSRAGLERSPSSRLCLVSSSACLLRSPTTQQQAAQPIRCAAGAAASLLQLPPPPPHPLALAAALYHTRRLLALPPLAVTPGHRAHSASPGRPQWRRGGNRHAAPRTAQAQADCRHQAAVRRHAGHLVRRLPHPSAGTGGDGTPRKPDMQPGLQ